VIYSELVTYPATAPSMEISGEETGNFNDSRVSLTFSRMPGPEQND
jgi:hypothetical protein